MAFDPSQFQISDTSQKYMPVVLLLDVSGSMEGDKIDNLYFATTKMIDTFIEEGKKEIPYKVAIITFGKELTCHTRYTDAKDLQNLEKFEANGMTPLGAALKMAKAMIEDKTETKSCWYRPAVVLVSDGKPNDQYLEPMRAFINKGRTAKCQRISMAIGNDVDFDMLKNFASDESFVFKAEDANDIYNKFKLVTMSITSRTASTNPNDFAGANNTASETPSRRSQVFSSNNIEDDYL